MMLNTFSCAHLSCVYSLLKCLFMSFTRFLIGSLVFIVEYSKCSTYSSFIEHVPSKYSFPISRVFFHSLQDFSQRKHYSFCWNVLYQFFKMLWLVLWLSSLITLFRPSLKSLRFCIFFQKVLYLSV